MSSLVSQIFIHSYDPIFIAAAVFLIDGLLGDPAWLYSRIPHPVVIIGKGISLFENRLNQSDYSNFYRFILGAFISILVISVAVGIGIAVTVLCQMFHGGAIVLILISSSLIAYRGLFDGVHLVFRGLNQSVQQGQDAVSHIVGRDPKSLDEAGVARAAIESLAENFSDGTVAPLFWFLLLGLPGLLFYKAINTLDSMIGHHSDRYEYFGKFAARFDDIVNFIPARLTGVLIVLAAFLMPKAKGFLAIKHMWKDARSHKSVNAGWQEAALAGALGISLAGPRTYADQVVEDGWMNAEGRKNVTAGDIKSALHLYLVSGFLGIIILASFALQKII